MANVSMISNKASILLELIDRLKEGPVNYDRFCDTFELTRNQYYKFLRTLTEIGLDLSTGEKYSKESRTIFLLSDENLTEIEQFLESKIYATNITGPSKPVKLKKHNITGPSKPVKLKKPNITGPDRFSQKNISNLIVYVNGIDRNKKDVLIDLQRIMRVETEKEKTLINKAYGFWRNNYIKYKR